MKFRALRLIVHVFRTNLGIRFHFVWNIVTNGCKLASSILGHKRSFFLSKQEIAMCESHSFFGKLVMVDKVVLVNF